MGPDMVILPDDELGFFKTVEDIPIQKVISKGVVKAFIKAILPRAVGFNVRGFHANAR